MINAHEHGPHTCYCPDCNYELEVAEYVQCKTLFCCNCGTRMRAKETGERRGELRIAQQENKLPGSLVVLAVLGIFLFAGKLIEKKILP